MRPKRKADPIAIRLFIEERNRVDRLYKEVFSKRYPFSKIDHMIRLWLGLPVEEDPNAVLFDQEKDFLSGNRDSLPEGDYPSGTGKGIIKASTGERIGRGQKNK